MKPHRLLWATAGHYPSSDDAKIMSAQKNIGISSFHERRVALAQRRTIPSKHSWRHSPQNQTHQRKNSFWLWLWKGVHVTGGRYRQNIIAWSQVTPRALPRLLRWLSASSGSSCFILITKILLELRSQPEELKNKLPDLNNASSCPSVSVLAKTTTSYLRKYLQTNSKGLYTCQRMIAKTSLLLFFWSMSGHVCPYWKLPFDDAFLTGQYF